MPLDDSDQDIGQLAVGLWANTGAGRMPAGVTLDTDLRDACDRAVTLRSHARQVFDFHAAFSDFQTRVEDCLTSDQDDGSSVALLRLRHQGTHSGHGRYGAPTNKRALFRSVLELHLDGADLTAATILLDNTALLGQAGLDVRHMANAAPASALQPDRMDFHDSSPWGGVLAEVLTTAMDGDLSVLHRGYDPAVELLYPGQAAAGPHQAERFWLSLRAALPTATFHVNTSLGQEDALTPPRAAAFWSLSGQHDGWGRYGAPSGAAIRINGATFAEFGPRGLRREWTIIDDLAVWRQISAFSTANCLSSG
ncbi:ester cyclase [Pseudoprimorskyibacter insulae]|uniref:SnoaL-like domain-containing protein n=1 Tax=Pseudoprimorskyibacter insulae TaxID=1695997 RepID=A0A2R8ATU6_9RHOB|nr:ester cyclase [Pseudoprimorskyibacter insulae]SPF79466.1 hypothetical protein PRI8871_01262 [Pseudoprimorskyibacter insulae]